MITEWQHYVRKSEKSMKRSLVLLVILMALMISLLVLAVKYSEVTDFVDSVFKEKILLIMLGGIGASICVTSVLFLMSITPTIFYLGWGAIVVVKGNSKKKKAQ